MRTTLLLLGIFLIGTASRLSHGHRLIGQAGPLADVSVLVAERSGALVAPIDLQSELTPQEHSGRAHPHPHGDKVCASGCALSRHPTPRLTESEFERLVTRLVQNPYDDRALDELLFYGPQALAQLQSSKQAIIRLLPEEVHAMLQHELNRRFGTVALRLVTDSGKVLAELPAQRVPLDLRHEFDMREHGIPQLLASGTIKRVGRYRLWSRL